MQSSWMFHFNFSFQRRTTLFACNTPICTFCRHFELRRSNLSSTRLYLSRITFHNPLPALDHCFSFFLSSTLRTSRLLLMMYTFPRWKAPFVFRCLRKGADRQNYGNGALICCSKFRYNLNTWISSAGLFWLVHVQMTSIFFSFFLRVSGLQSRTLCLVRTKLGFDLAHSSHRRFPWAPYCLLY